MENKTEIKLESLTKRFGEVVAVNKINITINQGEFFALLGPSGCGKTTILRLLAGLEEATEGRIIFNGQDVTATPPKERDVAMVFQDYALYPHMTVSENIGYPLKVRKIKENRREESVKETANNFRIEEYLERKPGQLSGGQQQRVALARAIIHKPEVFLFDEPLSNLDARLRLESRTFLKHMQSELGITTIYVTHDQAEALALADRIAVLKDGIIRQLGSPQEVYEKPADSFVADFIGDPPMNLIDCRFLPGSNRVVFPGVEVNLPREMIDLQNVDQPDRDYIFGIRPEHVSLSRNGQLEGEVYAIETLGSRTLVTITLGESRVRLNSYEPGLNIRIGQTVNFQFLYEMVRIYNRETGKLLEI